MRGRRTHTSNKVYSLPGGTEDNNLWVRQTEQYIASVWEPTPAERKLLAEGHNIELKVYGQGLPPMSMTVTDVPLGKS
jgi:hypothetical protein